MKQPASYRWLYYILIGLIVILVFHLKFGLAILLPSHDAWLYGRGSDMLPDICTWQYYRYSPLGQGALGVFNGYGYPQVTGVGNTNIVPLIGMPLKLFNRWLPEHFQYLGLFLFTCYLLQAWFADRLLAALQLPVGYWRFTAVVVILLAAPFLDRFAHLALCAHWLILAALATYFSVGLSQARALRNYSILSFAAILTHPYLILFPLLVAFADGLQRIRKNEKWITLFVFPLVSIVSIWLGAFLSGVFSLAMGSSSAGGLGVYNSNLNTFWNNIGKSNFAPLDLPAFEGQYEGYAYLGLGVLILWVTLLFQKTFRKALLRTMQQHWPLFIVLFAALIYAYAFNITFNKLELLNFHLERYPRLNNMLSIFRSSGRYIWLPYYILLIIPFVYYGHKLKLQRKWSAGLLLCILLIQIADMAKAIQRGIIQDNYTVSKEWTLLATLAKEAKVVYTYPVFQRDLVTPDDAQYLTSILAPLQIPITAGHLPRPDAPARQNMVDTLSQIHESGQWSLAKGSILITTKEKVPYFIDLQARHAIKMRRLGDYRILYSVDNQHIDNVSDRLGIPRDSIQAISLAAFLEEHKAHTIVILSADEASRSLKPYMRAELSRFSPLLGNIQDWEAYAAVWSHGKMLQEQKLAKGSTLDMKYTVANVPIKLRATSGIEQAPYLIVNGSEMQHLSRGVNVFVFNDSLQLARQMTFDLYETYYANR
ncbi:DUF6311 domain-containing protein [Edaphocola aurantiacus]|uniref:DUF6311 domain-containing protein n=1 Tax=Edaphocola aurantiacus TaxID=2601682 RepID=UPI001C948788|nr:DUF6311 domain-containing protein [Edaphocola aurantiacus]